MVSYGLTWQQADDRASPDEMNHPHDYTAKRDIWNSAILFVELLFGSQANWTYPNLTYLRESELHVSGIFADSRSLHLAFALCSIAINFDGPSKEETNSGRNSRQACRVGTGRYTCPGET